MKIRKIDIIILISCIFVFGLLTVFVRFSGDKGDFVRISVNGEEKNIISLGEDGEYVIEGYNGGKNTLVVENGEAKMRDADCPDGLCINQKPISAGGETICCLPNRVMVEVIADSDKEVDAIAR